MIGCTAAARKVSLFRKTIAMHTQQGAADSLRVGNAALAGHGRGRRFRGRAVACIGVVYGDYRRGSTFAKQ